MRFLRGIALICLGSTCAAVAQTPATQITPGNATGSARVGSSSVPVGNVDLTNGNLNIAIPLITLPGRGGNDFTLALLYDSKIWQPHISFSNTNQDAIIHWQSETSSGVNVGGLGWHLNLPSITVGTVQNDDNGNPYELGAFIITMPDGTKHSIAGAQSGLDSDNGEGWHMTYDLAAPFRPTNIVVITAAGIRYHFAGDQALADKVTDSNGNFVTIGSTITDSAGHQISMNGTGISYTDTTNTSRSITYGFTGIQLFQSSGQYATPSTPFTYPKPANNVCSTICYSYLWVYQPTPNSYYTMLSSVTMPDGSSYSFDYNGYGELTKIVYPNHGYARYAYQAKTHGEQYWYDHGVITTDFREVQYQYLCASSSGTCSSNEEVVTAYDPTIQPETPNNQTNTVTVTQGGMTQKKTTYTYSNNLVNENGYLGPLETSRISYAADGTTPLSATVTSYISPHNNFFVPQYITNYICDSATSAVSSTTRLDYDTASFFVLQPFGGALTVQNASNTSIEITGNVASKKVYDFVARGDCGTTTPTSYGTLLRTDTTSFTSGNPNYGPAFPAHLLGLPGQQTTYDGNGNIAAQTTYEYDVTSGAYHAALTPTGSALQHGSPLGGSYRGNLTAVTKRVDGSNSVTAYTQYNDAGLPVASIDPKHNSTTYSYEPSYLHLTEVDGPTTGGTSHIDYYHSSPTTGQILWHNDQNSSSSTDTTHRTSFSYDEMLRLSEVDYPDGGQSTVTPNSNWTLKKTKAGTAFAPTYLYECSINDGLGRQVQTQAVPSAIASCTKDSAPSGTIFYDTAYDGMNRTIGVSNPYFSINDSTYGITSYAYDGLGRKLFQCQPDNGNIAPCAAGSSYLQWSYSRNTTTSYDELRNSWKRTSDALGRLTNVVEPTAALTGYTYDALDNLRTVTQSGVSGETPRTRSFSYDALSRLLCASNPEISSAACPTTATSSYTAGTTGYSYDANGNVSTKIAPAPNSAPGSGTTATTTYQYDALNRLTSEFAAASTSPNTLTHSWHYDMASVAGVATINPVGHLTYIGSYYNGTPFVNASGTMYWNYDAMGRVLGAKICTPAGCNNTNANNSQWYDLSYTYDLAGNMTSYTDGFGTKISQNYDGAGRLSSVTSSRYDTTHPGTLWTANSYGPVGLTQATLGNGVVNTLQYKNRTWLQSSSAVSPIGQTVYSEGLTYYPNGSPQTVTDPVNGNWTYSYDNVNRISTGVSANTGQGCQFSYDTFGNRKQQVPYQGSCTTQLLNFSTNTNHIDGYCYDAAGNVLDAGGCALSGMHHQNFYDGYGSLLTGNYNFTDATSYTQDALGHRIGKWQGGQVERMYLFGLDGNPVSEMDGSGNWLQTNIHAGGQFLAEYQGNETYFLHNDHLGTIRAQSNSSATRTMTCSNLPFGDLLNCNGSTGPSGYHFTGKERDAESGLDNFGARYYSSTMGRWMSPDPSGLAYADITNPQSFNLYSYVLNNPLTNIDPRGLDCVYFNDAGNAAESVDHNSSSGECGKTGGDWVNGTTQMDQVHYNQASDNFSIKSWDTNNNYNTVANSPGSQQDGADCYGNCSVGYFPSSKIDPLNPYAQGVIGGVAQQTAPVRKGLNCAPGAVAHGVGSFLGADPIPGLGDIAKTVKEGVQSAIVAWGAGHGSAGVAEIGANIARSARGVAPAVAARAGRFTGAAFEKAIPLLAAVQAVSAAGDAQEAFTACYATAP